jgi:glyoxylase-like metal-dependent hydrolase (beta-lactamase superfamily II)
VTAADLQRQPWLVPDYVDADGNIGLRVQAIVIEVAGRRVLVDPCVGNGKTRQLPFWNDMTWPFLEHFADAGFSAGSIDTVVHTHLHADHVGYDDQLPNARIVIQRGELEYAADPLFPPFLFGPDDHAKLTGPLRDRVEIVDGDVEVAPGIRTVRTGGHSPNHQMIYVDVPSGQAVITGDNAYLADPGVTQGVPPGYYVNLFEVTAALERIRQDADHVLPMHDETVYDRYPDGVR